MNTINMPEYINDKKGYAIDREKALANPQRISEIVAYAPEKQLP